MAKYIVIHGAVKIGKKFVRTHVDKKTGKTIHPEVELEPAAARHIDPHHTRLLTQPEFQKRQALEKAERELEDEKKKELAAAKRKIEDDLEGEDDEDGDEDEAPPAKPLAAPPPAPLKK